MSRLAHSHQPTMDAIVTQRAIEDGNEDCSPAEVKATHTRGPLRVHDQRDDTISHRHSIMSDTGVVALITLSDGRYSDLILWAAAPDLFDLAIEVDALAEYIEDFGRLCGGEMRRKYGDDPMAGYDNVIRRYRKLAKQATTALAKATGEAA